MLPEEVQVFLEPPPLEPDASCSSSQQTAPTPPEGAHHRGTLAAATPALDDSSSSSSSSHSQQPQGCDGVEHLGAATGGSRGSRQRPPACGRLPVCVDLGSMGRMGLIPDPAYTMGVLLRALEALDM